jgi:hypothetical protein
MSILLGLTDSETGAGVPFTIPTSATYRADYDARYVNVTGDTMTGQLQGIGGSASVPSFSFTGDANTGIFSPAADTLSLSTNGTEGVRVFSDGGVQIGGVFTSSPGVGVLSTPAADSFFHGVTVGSGIAVNFQENTVVGYSALTLSGAQLRFATAVGAQAMEVSTARGNTAVGYHALLAVSTGEWNTAIGTDAMKGVTGGSDNVAVGWSALSSSGVSGKCSAVGVEALFSAAHSEWLSALGYRAGYNQGAGYSSWSMTYLGAFADRTAGGDMENSTAIGVSAIVTQSNMVQLGDTSVTLVRTSGLVDSAGLHSTSLVRFDEAENHAITTASISGEGMLDDTHYTLLVDASTADISGAFIDLPDSTSSNISGRIYIVKKIDSSANPVSVRRTGASDLIDGAITNVITTQYQSRSYQCSPTSAAANRWNIIQGYNP